MHWVVAVVFLGNHLLSPVLACGSGHVHARRSPVVIADPTEPLVWGDINILHTTDSHGWLGGHNKPTPPEPNYSADLGSFSSFVTHMQDEAERRNVDLLLVDSGDLHDGNGLTDGFLPGDVNGHEALKLFSKLPYDVLAVGNHELYKYEVVYDVYKNFVPQWNGRYLTSNVNITVSDNKGHTTSMPLGDRYAKFKTRLGRSITSFGILFSFTGNSANTTVQSPSDMVQEAWFREAIVDEPDVFLLVGHMAVRNSEWPVVFDAIRAVHPYTPILIFGGHTHIRDCVQLDGRSMSMASGQYMETIGWMSAKLDKKGGTEDIDFTRRYLDANLVTYSYHTGKSGRDFHTDEGREISAGIQALSDRFDLSHQFGISPSNFFRFRVPMSSPQSLPSIFASEIIPTVLSSSPRASIPRMFVINSGALRGDIYEGPFTRNDQFIVSPFTNGFEYISNVSSKVATRILDELNHSGLPARKRDLDHSTAMLVDQVEASSIYQQWIWEQWERWRFSQTETDDSDLTLGYVTKDACPGVGDDVLHKPIPYYPVPPFIGPKPADSDTMDLVFVSFIRNSILQIVNTINAGSVPNVTTDDVKLYSDLILDEVFGLYAETQWK